jgi:hypothetical protein
MGLLSERESLAEKKLEEKRNFPWGQALLARKPAVSHY